MQDIFENSIITISRFVANKEYDKAILLLDRIKSLAGTRDHDGWFINSILSTEAMLMEQQDKLSEALSRYCFVNPRNYHELTDNQRDKARVLIMQKKYRSAIKELDYAIDILHGIYHENMLDCMIDRFKASFACGILFPSRYVDIIKALSLQYSVDIPDNASTSINEQINYQYVNAVAYLKDMILEARKSK